MKGGHVNGLYYKTGFLFLEEVQDGWFGANVIGVIFIESRSCPS